MNLLRIEIIILRLISLVQLPWLLHTSTHLCWECRGGDVCDLEMSFGAAIIYFKE